MFVTLVAFFSWMTTSPAEAQYLERADLTHNGLAAATLQAELAAPKALHNIAAKPLSR
jgi:hypothetical protein